MARTTKKCQRSRVAAEEIHQEDEKLHIMEAGEDQEPRAATAPTDVEEKEKLRRLATRDEPRMPMKREPRKVKKQRRMHREQHAG